MHAEGAYIHDLSDFWGYYEGDWRLQYNREFRGDVYATHGMGPAAQELDIHRGDKMNTLVSMDTKPVNIPEYLIEQRGVDRDSAYRFATAAHDDDDPHEKGTTIHTNDVPHRVLQPMYQESGTKGFANTYPNADYALEAIFGGDRVPNMRT